MAKKIVLLCATERGRQVLNALLRLRTDEEITVFSFAEEPWEPPYLEQIKSLAVANGCQFYLGKNVASSRLREFWDRKTIDLILAVSWRYIVPSEIFRRAVAGAFVFHDSFLPAYRGFSPTVWAMLNGEPSTGVTLLEMAESVDSGAIVEQRTVPIGKTAQIADVMQHVTACYITILESTYAHLIDGTYEPHPQDPAQASYTCKFLPEDARIDWSASTERIFDLIRGYSRPYSGAYTSYGGKKLIIWNADRPLEDREFVGRIPGRVVDVLPDNGVRVLTGNGTIILREIQLGSETPVVAGDTLNSITAVLGRYEVL